MNRLAALNLSGEKIDQLIQVYVSTFFSLVAFFKYRHKIDMALAVGLLCGVVELRPKVGVGIVVGQEAGGERSGDGGAGGWNAQPSTEQQAQNKQLQQNVYT